ncbi:MAG: hypothetical protein LBS43_01590 [Prevotellaceae bacterium]|jgi:hypothetical protein|nr:hypothetical protein [Prevotellaceae bacterium]
MSAKTKTDSSESQEELIANPIYDHVFKYLMEDNKVARKLISTIINEEVIELSFAPQEYVQKLDDKVLDKSWSVYRLDFIARIHTNEGLKIVMIEVQKISLNTDIMRFRRYLGSQYRNYENSYIDSEKTTHAMPIYCIFFLGDGLDVKGIPVITVNPYAADMTTGKELKDLRNEFIETLHHRSWIVQVPELKGRRRNEMEILLSIFDQANRMNDHHILNLKEEHFPEEYRPVIRRLQQAAVSKEIREAMLVEDDILEHFRIAERKNQVKLEEKDKIISEKDTVIAEKDTVIAEKEAVIARERAEKEALIAKLAALENTK